MKEPAKYQKFMDMKDRVKYVQDQVQGEAKSIDFILNHKFSEEGFMEHYGTQSKAAIKLFTYRQMPKTQKIKGIVVLFHSIGGHIGLMAHLANRLAAQGYIAAGFDQRGHGKSQGERGYLDDMKEILKDNNSFIAKLTKLHPNLPLFFLGHGSGALIALAITKQNKSLKIDGLILGNPSLKRPESSKVISALSGFALKIMPNKTGLFAFDYANQTRNPNASSLMKKDEKMYHEKVYVGSLVEMQDMMDIIDEKYWEKMELPPIALIQGELDRASDASNTIKFYQKIKNKDKELWYFEKMWHMWLYEEEYPQIQQKIIKWLNGRVK